MCAVLRRQCRYRSRTEDVFLGQQFLYDRRKPYRARCAARSGHAGGRHCCLRRCGRTGSGITGISAHPARAGERDADGEKAPGLAKNPCRRVRYRVAGADRAGHRRDGFDKAHRRERHDRAGRRAAQALRHFASLAARLCAIHWPQGRPTGLSHPDTRGKTQAPKAHRDCHAAHPAFDSSDAVCRRVLLRWAKILLHFAADFARMYAALLPHFRGQKAAGAGAGAHCRARCAECGRARCVLHAAGI